MTTAQKVLDYLSHLSQIKKELGAFSVSEDEGIFTIFDSNNIPKLSLTKEIYKIFCEIET